VDELNSGARHAPVSSASSNAVRRSSYRRAPFAPTGFTVRGDHRATPGPTPPATAAAPAVGQQRPGLARQRTASGGSIPQRVPGASGAAPPPARPPARSFANRFAASIFPGFRPCPCSLDDPSAWPLRADDDACPTRPGTREVTAADHLSWTSPRSPRTRSAPVAGARPSCCPCRDRGPDLQVVLAALVSRYAAWDRAVRRRQLAVRCRNA